VTIGKINPLHALLEFIEITLVCSSVAFISYFLLGQILEVKGASMEPTIHDNEHLFAEKNTPKFMDMTRGKIIVFTRPDEKDKLIIKRIIALPGESVTIQYGNVYINTFLFSEPYLPMGTITTGGPFIVEGNSYKVPNDSYFVLGDNRKESIDSRFWGFLPKVDVLGQALFVYKPIKNVRWLK
jgi:signal peptidase I